MKSNFDTFKKWIDSLNNNELSISNVNKLNRYLRDLEFLFRETEKKIYARELLSSCYNLRITSDLSKKFIYFLITKSNDDVFLKWNKRIKRRLKRVREFNDKYNYDYSFQDPSIKKMLNLYPNHAVKSFEEVGNFDYIISVYDDMNKWMHYKIDYNFLEENNAHNKNDKSTFYFHRSQVRFSKPSLDEVINYLKTIWLLTRKILKDSKIFSNIDELEEEFDEKIYYDLKPALTKLLNIKQIDDLIKSENCPICNEGKFDIPNIELLMKQNNKFEYGAFIECNNPNCKAFVDKTLKIKHNIELSDKENATCHSCKESSLQKRINLLEEGKNIYIACKKCSWNNKSSINNTLLINEMLEEGRLDNNNFEWLYDEEDYN
ncbi:MAG: hypothetical protein TYPL_1970 [Candidatus Tyloplasma litorale]|nr:MAG: hypothetical protein TYPL_1970 [Mycoplasmatales bacterium]